MIPLILRFAEQPNEESPDLPPLHYSNELNLTVLTDNGEPAVRYLQAGTQTATRVAHESSDSDKSDLSEQLSLAMGTTTGGKSPAPPDHDLSYNALLTAMLAATTTTEIV